MWNFLKKAGSALMGAAPSVIGGLASLRGGREARAFSAQQAQKQMDFQERMSSSAHQREVADLRAAGLNPILSATGGRGASSPGGAMAVGQDVVTPSVNTALSVRRQRAEVKNLEVTGKLIREQWIKTNWEANSAKQTAMMNVNSRIMSDILLQIDRGMYGGPAGPLLRGSEKFGAGAASAAGVFRLLKGWGKGSSTVTDIVRHGPNLTRKITKKVK